MGPALSACCSGYECDFVFDSSWHDLTFLAFAPSRCVRTHLPPCCWSGHTTKRLVEVKPASVIEVAVKILAVALKQLLAGVPIYSPREGFSYLRRGGHGHGPERVEIEFTPAPRLHPVGHNARPPVGTT
jgi:hypothetical protein